MKLNNEFTVAAPLERTWSTLLDIGRVAGCLPGAELEPGDGDGSYRGGMRVKLGPMVASYRGVARLVDADDDARTTTLEVEGRETKGQGTAAATIRSRLDPLDAGRTRVQVETELQVTGRQAQFGRGVMEDVAGTMLREFARRLEQLILDDEGPALAAQEPAGAEAGATHEPAGAVPASATPQPPAARPQAPDVLDLGPAVRGPLARRSAALGGAALLAAGLTMLGLRAARGRRSISLRLDLRL